MKTARLSNLIVQLGQQSASAATPDAALLGRFLADRDQEAFALLVRRHGRLVFGVCRRVTGDHHLAEDAFQAVFVVLATKAGSVRPRSALPAWLYGVAHRVALRARTMRDRRRRHESPVKILPDRASPVDDGAESADLVAVLDEEIARLPEYQRVPVVVCELEGRSRMEAAAQLGISEGTLSSRLARARKALADRLRQRGIALSAAGLTAAFAQLASGGVPNEVVSKTVACAITPALVPTTVVVLSHGVLRIMLIQKLKVLTLALSLAIPSGLLASATLAAADPSAATMPTRSVELFALRTDPPTKTVGQKPLPGPSRLLVFRDGAYVLIDPDGKNEKQLVEKSEEFVYRGAKLSPDGKWLAVTMQSAPSPAAEPNAGTTLPPPKLYVRTLDEKAPGNDLEVECRTFVWSADGSEIACCNFPDAPKGPEEVTHFIIDVKTKQKKPLKFPDGHLMTDWSADGKLFLTTRVVVDKDNPQNRTVQLYLVNRDGTERQALTDGKQLSSFGRFSPDGKRVLYIHDTRPKDGKGDPKVEMSVLGTTTGKSSAVSDMPLNARVMGFCWSPDGKRIAYVWRQVHEGKPQDIRDKETESHLVVCDSDGKNAKTIVSEKGPNPWADRLRDVDWR